LACSSVAEEVIHVAIEFSTGGSSHERFESALNEVKESGLRSLSNIASKAEGISLVWSKEAVKDLVNIEDDVAKRVVASTARSIKLVGGDFSHLDKDLAASDVARKVVVDTAFQPKIEGVQFAEVPHPDEYKIAFRPYSKYERLQFGDQGAVVLGVEKHLPAKGVPQADL
jgi:hypothetical protein